MINSYLCSDIHVEPMKNRMLFLFLLTILLSVGQAVAADYTFDRTSRDLGTVTAGKTTRVTFTVTNNGTQPLLITAARVSCKCVKIVRPRGPILPGGSAELVVTYKDRHPGAFYKTIQVETNADPASTRLTLKGTITQ